MHTDYSFVDCRFAWRQRHSENTDAGSYREPAETKTNPEGHLEKPELRVLTPSKIVAIPTSPFIPNIPKMDVGMHARLREDLEPTAVAHQYPGANEPPKLTRPISRSSPMQKSLNRFITTCGALLLLAVAACSPKTKEAKALRDECNAGKATACHEFALRLQKGDHVLRDEARATELFGKACDENVGASCASLGNIDTTRSQQLFARACEHGALNGCDLLGSHLQKQGDVARATPLYKQACDGGEMSGCAHLGVIEVEQQQFTEAATLFKKSCDAKVTLGCEGIGKLHAAGTGVAQNDSLAASYYEKSCEKRSETGCYLLGTSYETGKGRPKDFNHASRLYRDACEDRNGEACARLAMMYETGAGVYRDTAAAGKFRKEACEAGHKESCKHS